jgi:propionyl-CoA carboxylase alpha chain
MFKKILVANRGEIACRVMRTARAMGIKTVAVYSEADANALHVQIADEAVLIGPAAAAQSYLVMDKILAAVRETGAEAVHPGYGFLSENAAFAEALEEAGVAFIGPNTRAIGAMGDKIASKKLAAEAGVTTIPGHMGVIADADEAARIADEIGYPVMIKASAGGGGKGMRIAHDATEAREGFVSATSEAVSSFGDDRVFIEKFIVNPRHIEIQVLGDNHGNVIYLGERECSIQRRHQKVIEEAPSPALDEETRRAMGEQAVRLARAVSYNTAGTVEFVVGENRDFYFLEMNTRLQVEHPVTEMITGVDLVEQMIRVAAGEKLAIRQEDVTLNGWAMECRVYAEDPIRGFLPSIGRIRRYQPPAQNSHVRVDSGIFEGAEISMFYDPMIAKLITHAPTRDQAIAEMRGALDRFYIRGIEHNISFLSAVLGHPRFGAGRLSTGFIAEEYPDGFQGAVLDDEGRAAAISLAVLIHQREIARRMSISGQSAAWRPVSFDQWAVSLDGEEHVVGVSRVDRGFDVDFADYIHNIRGDWRPGEPVFEGTFNGRHVSFEIDRLAEGYRLTHDGAQMRVVVRNPRAAELARLMPEKVVADTSKYLLCPMPGLVVSLAVTVGQVVKAGDPLAVVEAMKMENVLRAERDGVIAAIKAEPGDSLAVDQVILEFED